MTLHKCCCSALKAACARCENCLASRAVEVFFFFLAEPSMTSWRKADWRPAPFHNAVITLLLSLFSVSSMIRSFFLFWFFWFFFFLFFFLFFPAPSAFSSSSSSSSSTSSSSSSSTSSSSSSSSRTMSSSSMPRMFKNASCSIDPSPFLFLFPFPPLLLWFGLAMTPSSKMSPVSVPWLWSGANENKSYKSFVLKKRCCLGSFNTRLAKKVLKI